MHLCKSFVSPDCDNKITPVFPFLGMSFTLNSAGTNGTLESLYSFDPTNFSHPEFGVIFLNSNTSILYGVTQGDIGQEGNLYNNGSIYKQ